MEWDEKKIEERALVLLNCAVASVCLPFPFAWTSFLEFCFCLSPLLLLSLTFLPSQGSNLEHLGRVQVPCHRSIFQSLSFYWLFCLLVHLFIHLNMCTHMLRRHVYHSMFMEVGGQLCESSYLPMHRFWGLNLDHHTFSTNNFYLISHPLGSLSLYPTLVYLFTFFLIF